MANTCEFTGAGLMEAISSVLYNRERWKHHGRQSTKYQGTITFVDVVPKRENACELRGLEAEIRLFATLRYGVQEVIWPKMLKRIADILKNVAERELCLTADKSRYGGVTLCFFGNNPDSDYKPVSECSAEELDQECAWVVHMNQYQDLNASVLADIPLACIDAVRGMPAPTDKERLALYTKSG